MINCFEQQVFDVQLIICIYFVIKVIQIYLFWNAQVANQFFAKEKRAIVQQCKLIWYVEYLTVLKMKIIENSSIFGWFLEYRVKIFRNFPFQIITFITSYLLKCTDHENLNINSWGLKDYCESKFCMSLTKLLYHKWRILCAQRKSKWLKFGSTALKRPTKFDNVALSFSTSEQFESKSSAP